MKVNINFVYESMTNAIIIIILMKQGSHAIPLTCAYNDYEHEVHIEF